MIEPTYSFFKLLSEFAEQLVSVKMRPRFLNNDRMHMGWLKHEMFWSKFSL
jgi:hypothetical protein